MARILIADDDRDSRDLLETVLERAGHETIQAGNGRDALRRYDAAGADVAIVDIFMPAMDGLEVIRALRQRSSTLKIIAISAGWSMRLGGDYGVLDDARQLGANAVVRKPFYPERIRQMVDELLGNANPQAGP